MARGVSAQNSQNSQTSRSTRNSRDSQKVGGSRFLRIFPESWGVYILERLHDACAIFVTLVSLAVLAALMSYTPADPSFNTAGSNDDIQNWMGAVGAHLSDILLQIFGVGAFVLPSGLLMWGWRMWKKEDFGPFWGRFAALLAAAILLSIAGAAIPASGWSPYSTWGGAGGILLLSKITKEISPVISFYPHICAAVVCGLTGMTLWAVGIALKRSERQAVVETFLSGGMATLDGAGSLWTRYKLWRQKIKARQNESETSGFMIQEREIFEDDDADEDEEDDDDYAPHQIEVVRTTKKPASKSAQSNHQAQLNLRDQSEWELPPVDLLSPVPPPHKEDKLDEHSLRKNAEVLQNVLSDYNVRGEIKSIFPGPVVTLYELEPAPGTKNSRVISLSDDIARSMSAVSVRVAVPPGRNVIGIELPNKRRQTVYLRDLLEGDEFQKTPNKLPLVLGKDIGGHPIIADLSRMPHLLVAGTTGSGKSVAVNTMILSLLYRLPPEKCRFIMIDPKMLELSVYDDIPHLLSPVVTDPGRAVVALKWAVQEMENRYRNMSKLGVRNIEGYNARIREAVKKGEILMRKVQTGFDPETGKPVFEEQPLDLTELPYIVIVVDEFADLMLVAGKDVENAIQRLAQMARAAGLHLIMATQRPSVDVITGVIKANFPTRISFQVTSKIDSRTILGEGGAETLLGMGDMLYMAAGGRITRVHGPFVADREVEDVVNFLKAQGEPAYLEEVTEGELFSEDGEFGGGSGGGEDGGEELYDEAVAIVAREGKASTSFIQRHLQIGYNRAARIIEQMEKEGVVSPANRVGKREVLIGSR